MKKQLTEAQRKLQKLAGIITEDAPVTIKKATSNKDESTPFDAGKAVTKMLKESLTNPRLVTENPTENPGEITKFQALEKELDTVKAKDPNTGEEIEFDGDDVSFMTDKENDEIYVEILPARKKEFGQQASVRRKLLMNAIKQILGKKEYKAYKIDPDSKESFDGSTQFTIVNTSTEELQ